MLLGILSDTHNELARTRYALQLLLDTGAESLIHCGDLASPGIVEACSLLPCWFVFGNHDADSIPSLRQAAADFGVTCLGWGGVIELAGKRIGVTHGHMSVDVRNVLSAQPDYLFSGHVHFASDVMMGSVRRINPGALYRCDEFTVALLDTDSGELRSLTIPG